VFHSAVYYAGGIINRMKKRSGIQSNGIALNENASYAFILYRSVLWESYTGYLTGQFPRSRSSRIPNFEGQNLEIAVERLLISGSIGILEENCFITAKYRISPPQISYGFVLLGL